MKNRKQAELNQSKLLLNLFYDDWPLSSKAHILELELGLVLSAKPTASLATKALMMLCYLLCISGINFEE